MTMASVRTLGGQMGLSDETLQDVRETPIRDLPGLSNRLCERLMRAGVGTIGELAACTDNGLLAIPYFGQGSLDQVRGALARLALGEHRRTLGAQAGLSEETIEEARDTPVGDLPGLSTRILEHLMLIGIETVDGLAHCRDSDLLKAYNLGHNSLQKVKAALRRFADGERPISSQDRATTAPGPTQRLLTAWLDGYPSLARELTLQEIGDALGVTRERARQILNKLGMSERRYPRGRPIGQDHPGYGAYLRALSRGASESVARERARQAATRWRRRQDAEYREKERVRGRERSRARYHSDPDYRAKKLEKDRRYREKKRAISSSRVTHTHAAASAGSSGQR